MDRRSFIQLLAATQIPAVAAADDAPRYRVVSDYRPAPTPGMPGPYPGRVAAVKSAACLDASGRNVPTLVITRALLPASRSPRHVSMAPRP